MNDGKNYGARLVTREDKLRRRAGYLLRRDSLDFAVSPMRKVNGSRALGPVAPRLFTYSSAWYAAIDGNWLVGCAASTDP
jgi:hypothetical protein